jgi:YD repeat-containing protein
LYNGLDRTTQLIALDQNGDGSTSDNETTRYLYEDAYDASLVTNSIYPDSADTTSAGTDQVKMTFDLQGKPTSKTDQRGTKIDYLYNGSTQLLEWDRVSILGSGVDSQVQSIQRFYDGLRRLQKIRSNSTTTGGTVRNEIYMTFDETLSAKQVYQSQEGAQTGSTPYVQYDRDFSAVSGVYDDLARVYQVRYPSGRYLRMEFGSGGSIEDRLNRVARLKGNLKDNGADAYYSTYGYTSGGRVVRIYYDTPGIAGQYDADGNGTYEFLDGFGRIVTRDWRVGASLRDQVTYTYDYAGNRLTRDIPSSLYATDDHDHQYTYDGGHRLTYSKRGTLSSGSIAAPPFQQQWTLDGLGNWSTFQEDTGNNGWDLSQLRSHNLANELTQINFSGTNLAHDGAGNMTKIPQPTNWSASYDLVYDAWNRLV